MSQLNKHLTTDHGNALTDPPHHAASVAKDDLRMRDSADERSVIRMRKSSTNAHTHIFIYMYTGNQNASKVRRLMVGQDLLHPPIVCVHGSVCADQYGWEGHLTCR